MEFESLWAGFIAIGDDPRMVIMWGIAGFLLYWGIAQKKEPSSAAESSSAMPSSEA